MTRSRAARRALFGLGLAVLCSFPAGAQSSDPATNSKTPRVNLSMPQQTQIINLSLMDALVSVGAADLAGVFGFIPESNAPPAFADYLLRQPSLLKRFVKKGERDLKETGAINEWDQQVFLYVITLNNSGVMGKQPIADKWMKRVTALTAVPAVSLEEMTQRKRSKL